MTVRIITAPTVEPITLAEAKAHLRREDTNADDARILVLILAAREYVEAFTGRAMCTQTLELVLDSFPCSRYQRIALPRAPVQSVTSVKYLDSNGTEQTLSSSLYRLLADDLNPMLEPAYGEVWPVTREVGQSVTVRFVAGYGGAAAVPYAAKAACLLHVEAHYDRGELMMEKLLASCEALLYPLRLLSI